MTSQNTHDDGVDRAVDVTIDGSPFTLEQLDGLLGVPLRVGLTDELWSRVEASHAIVDRIAGGMKPAYGINTGFGHLCNKRIALDDVRKLQTNLIISHAVAVGDPVPVEIVRWMLLLKIKALSIGVSGVSRAVLAGLCRWLSADAIPEVPCQGSLGASGDLAPLAHMVMPLIGRGRVYVKGQLRDVADVMPETGIEQVTLGPKDGLALINGTQLMAAYAAAVVVRARRLLRHADIMATMSLEAAAGSLSPFDERLHALRPHAGAVEVARNIKTMMAGSEILTSHATCGRVQDPYSLRCIPQVHGASRDAIRHAGQVVETEINAVTDNPILLDDETVVSGGLFHGQPLALVLDYMAIALAELASISERRVYLLLEGVGGLPVLLMKDTGVNSGFMIPQYTVAALVSENKGLCMPSSVDSIPTSLGQEDHVSMGARAAVKCWQVLKNVETVLAIEQLCAAQAMDFRAPLKAGAGPNAAHAEVRKCISFAEADRPFSEDIAASLTLLRSQRVLQAVESEVGALA